MDKNDQCSNIVLGITHRGIITVEALRPTPTTG